MPYGMSDVEYAKEVDRKKKAGIKLTASFDKAAYDRGKTQVGGGSSSGSSSGRSSKSSSNSSRSSGGSGYYSSTTNDGREYIDAGTWRPKPGATDYSSLIPPPTPAGNDYWSQYGGRDAYGTSQGNRYLGAYQSGDTDLMRRLEADAARVGYSLPSLIPAAQPTTAALVPAQQPVAPLPLPSRTPEMPRYEPEPFRFESPMVKIAEGQRDIPTLAALAQWDKRQRDIYNDQVAGYSEKIRLLENYYKQQREQQAAQQEAAAAQAELQRELEKQAYDRQFDLMKLRLPYEQPTANALLPYQQMTPYQQEQLNISRINANRPRGGSSSSGGSGGPGPQTAGERVNYATADAYSAVDAAVEQGFNADQIVKNITGQTANLVRAGVNIDELVEYVYSVAPAAPAPAKEPSWYTKLDQNKFGGWLPFGAAR